MPETVNYVRVRNIIRDQFIEFDFAVDDPTLYVELVLPKKEYKIFCTNNDVKMMSEEQCRLVDLEMEKWRYGTDTLASENRKST